MDQYPHHASEHRWAVKLTGDRVGLSHARAIFAPPNAIEVYDISPSPGRRITAAMGSALDAANSWHETFDLAERLTIIVSAILFMRDPRRHAPTLGVHEIYKRRADGWWDVRESIRPPAYGRAARSARFVRPGDHDPDIPTKPIKRSLLDATERDDVMNVLHTLKGNPDWFDLWKAAEPVDRDWDNLPQGTKSAQNKRDLVWFRASSTFHRHSPASPHWKTANDTLRGLKEEPMNIVDATRAVARLVGLWLDWKSAIHRRNRPAQR